MLKFEQDGWKGLSKCPKFFWPRLQKNGRQPALLVTATKLQPSCQNNYLSTTSIQKRQTLCKLIYSLSFLYFKEDRVREFWLHIKSQTRIIISTIVFLLPCWHIWYKFRVFPESLRWLVAQGRLKDAHALLKTYAEKSSVNVDSDALSSMLERCRAAESDSKTGIKRSPLDLVRTSKMRKRTVILCYNW